jgi:signal transduction histidine kinase
MVTNLAQVRALPAEAGINHIPFKLQGVVTYCDPDWRILFVQDGPNGTFVNHGESKDDPDYKLVQGQLVEMEGFIGQGLAYCNLADKHMRLLGEAPMPAALQLSDPTDFNDSAESRWVRFVGWVVSEELLGDRITLTVLAYPGRCVSLIFRGMDNATAESFHGALVEVTGVFALKVSDTHQKTGEYLVFNHNLNDIRKLKELPILSVTEFARQSGSSPTSEPVLISGTLEKQLSDRAFMVTAGTNAMLVEAQKSPLIPTQTSVEVFGFPCQRHDGLVLTNAFFRTNSQQQVQAQVKVRAPTPPPAPAENAKLPELTKVSDVRDLSPHEASIGYPARVTGVLTYYDPAHFMQFIQDDNAGIYVDVSRLPNDAKGPAAGQRVEVSGFSGSGDYAPIIHAQSIQVLEQQSPFPTPRPTTVQMLMTGAEDSQWVSLHGVIRRQAVDAEQKTVLVLATGDGLMKIHLPEVQERPAASDFVDAAVEVRGVCRTLFNERRQLDSVELFVPNRGQLRITESAPTNAFELAVHPITELFQFHVDRSGLHRAHLRGNCILNGTDGSFLLQDESGGIRVQLVKPQAFRVGQIVEVVGFPALSGGLPVLQEAEAKTSNGTRSLTPTRLTPESALDAKLNATLVQLDGRVIEHSSRARCEVLTVGFGPMVVEAALEFSKRGYLMEQIAPGSIVRLTGVYSTRLDDDHKPQSFQVLLRTPNDVSILSQPSWWSAAHTAWVLAGLAGISSLSLAWIGMLRRQVQQRTRELRQEIEERKQTEAHLAAEINERKRMEEQIEKNHKELLVVSRQAGMAEVATSVLHNVGNVLNSVNISANMIWDKIRHSRLRNLPQAAAMLQEHNQDLAEFLKNDPKGQKLPGYLVSVADHLIAEQQAMLKELESLTYNLEHINEIVAMQQNYAKVCGILESIKVTELVEDAVRMNIGGLQRHKVQVVRDYAPNLPKILVDKHKVLQILTNLIHNAKYACEAASREEKKIVLKITHDEGRVGVSVMDNGIGIPAENLTKIFKQGFTTRKGGHGFGLHSGALAAKELGGKLEVQSDGPGLGARFTLELPVGQPQEFKVIEATPHGERE